MLSGKDKAGNILLNPPPATGNVGIGISDPLTYKLYVAGDTRVNGLNINGAYSLPTTDGGANQVLQTDGTGIISWVSPWVTLFTFGRATGTNIPAALTELPRATGLDYSRGKVDMTNYTYCRLSVDHILVVCAPDGDLYLQYSTDQTTWITIGDETTEGIDLTTALGGKVSPWILIPAGAKADVWVRIVSENGDGADDPQVTAISLQVY